MILISRCFPRGSGAKGVGLWPLSWAQVSPASPPQGELNGQRGLVPSNFLEGPGPEASSSDREPGTPQAESQVSEELGSQLSSWGCTLPEWWGGGTRTVSWEGSR